MSHYIKNYEALDFQWKALAEKILEQVVKLSDEADAEKDFHKAEVIREQYWALRSAAEKHGVQVEYEEEYEDWRWECQSVSPGGERIY